MRVGHYVSGFCVNLINLRLAEWLRSEWDSYVERKAMRAVIRNNQRWETVSAAQDTLQIPLQQDVKIEMPTNSELTRLLYMNSFEHAERVFINRFLNSGDVFLDVGANVGLFSLIAGRIVGPQGKVYAFEPCHETVRLLRNNIQLNQLENIDLIEKAVTERTGEFTLYTAENGHDAWNTLASGDASAGAKAETIHGIRLDEFVNANKLDKIAMIKIDVEGWENNVLVGGYDTLSRPDAPVLQVEFTDDAAIAAGTSCDSLYNTLVALGYALYEYDPECNALIPSPKKQAYPYFNLYAIKNLEQVEQALHQSVKPTDIW